MAEGIARDGTRGVMVDTAAGSKMHRPLYRPLHDIATATLQSTLYWLTSHEMDDEQSSLAGFIRAELELRQ